MTREQVRDAVVAFLEQFVVRGASESLRDLTRRLVTDPELRGRLDWYLSDEMTEREGFDGMRAFLDAWSSEAESGHGVADVFDLLSWTDWSSDGETMDPAQWHDWLTAVSTAP